MKKIFCWLIIVLFAFPMVACSNKGNYHSANQNSNGDYTKMYLKIDNKNFEVELDVSATTQQLCKLLPMELDMTDLNGNEKYFYISTHLPTDKFAPTRIEAGDVMLYQDNCLVIFYESFSSPFYYTKIGKIKDTDGLKEAVGTGNARVLWSL